MAEPSRLPDYQLIRLFPSATPTVDVTPVKTIACVEAKPTIWAPQLASWHEDATPFNTALTRHGVVSKCRIEQGKAVLCTLHLLDGIKARFAWASAVLETVSSRSAGKHRHVKARFPADNADGVSNFSIATSFCAGPIALSASRIVS